MVYRVVRDFADALDKGHIYRAGDIYPRSGNPSEARVAELSGFGNKIGEPLIKAVNKEPDMKPALEETEKPRRGRRKALVE